MTSSREEAVRELERIEQGGAYAGLSRRHSRQARSDEGKITDLVGGVTRWRRWLDFLVDDFYSGKASALEPRVRTILRLGLYELLKTETPDHAVVNETVQCSKKMIGRRVTGLVNGILRTAIRRRHDLPQPTGHDRAEILGILHSHPTWMTRRWLKRFGEEQTIRLMAHNNERPRFGLRIRGATREDITDRLEAGEAARAPATLSPYLEDFVRVRRLQPVFQSRLLDEGLVLVQDEAAGVVVRILDPQPGERILDACAAPGGKAMYIADLVGPSGSVTGVDRNPARLNLLREESHRLELTNVETVSGDFRTMQPGDLGELFNRVLLDAPCSGFGVLSKRADLRWRKELYDLEELATMQSELLQCAADFVKPGGLLVYSTCTIEPEENEARVEAFLQQREDFQLEPLETKALEPFVTGAGTWQSLPFRHGIDGSFTARLRKTE